MNVDQAVERWRSATPRRDRCHPRCGHDLGGTPRPWRSLRYLSLAGCGGGGGGPSPSSRVVGRRPVSDPEPDQVLGGARAPELRPRADFTRASFPSGHSTAAAATYRASRWSSASEARRGELSILSAAVAVGVAVGATSVFLGVHWFSDALAGVVIGWAWFGLCAVAFGGRLIRFGAPAEVAGTPSAHAPPSRYRGTRSSSQGTRRMFLREAVRMSEITKSASPSSGDDSVRPSPCPRSGSRCTRLEPPQESLVEATLVGAVGRAASGRHDPRHRVLEMLERLPR